MQHYLFVHFKEKTTPDGEQVYFGLSRDGFRWEEVNGGRPVLWAYYGDQGVRDHTIVRADDGFHIFSTDLSLSYGMRGKYANDWQKVGQLGSRCLSHWRSDDLVNWTEQALIPFGDGHMGCRWAPDIIRDRDTGEWLLHWSATYDGAPHAIYGVRTRDFAHFSQPELIYRKADSSVIDSAIYDAEGYYCMFVKSGENPDRVMLLRSRSLRGEWERVPLMDKRMSVLESSMWEAPTALQLPDGRWCLFLDFYGVQGAGQGYRPFVADRLSEGDFVMADEQFTFPYRFKHGTVLPITEEEYERIRGHVWPW